METKVITFVIPEVEEAEAAGMAGVGWVWKSGTGVGWLEVQVTKDGGNQGENSMQPGELRGKHPGLGKDAR